jgi:hypothetical protein
MSGWIHTDYNSTRWTNRFAFVPVRTFDAGWIWLRRYWLRECSYGWGFYDLHPYLRRPRVAS